MRSVTRVVAFGLLLALILPGSESAAGTQKITELDFVFTPNPVSVVLGDTITWQNQVQLQHNTTEWVYSGFGDVDAHYTSICFADMAVTLTKATG